LFNGQLSLKEIMNMDLPLLKELCDARGKLLDAKNKAKNKALSEMDKQNDKLMNNSSKSSHGSQYK